MLEECQKRLEGRVTPEFLRCQIEVGTRVCSSLAEARADLAHLRATVAEVAAAHGLAPIAAATHPFASWTAQKPTERERYLTLARDMQAPARRLIICGLHVHVRLEDPQLRIDLLGQVAYFLPHLLALDLLALLARQRHRAEVLPGRGLQRDAAHRPARELR